MWKCIGKSLLIYRISRLRVASVVLNSVEVLLSKGGLGGCLHSGPTPLGREDSAPRTEVTAVLRSTSASRCRILIVRKEMVRNVEFGA